MFIQQPTIVFYGIIKDMTKPLQGQGHKKRIGVIIKEIKLELDLNNYTTFD